MGPGEAGAPEGVPSTPVGANSTRDRQRPDPAHIAADLARARAAIEQARALVFSRVNGLPTPALPEAQRGRSPVAERLKASEARFRALVQVAGHASWTVDAEGRMESPQPAWQVLTGQSLLEARGTDGYGWLDAIHPGDRVAVRSAYLDIIAHGDVLFEHRARLRRRESSGQYGWRHVLLRAAPVRGSDGTVQEWVGTSTDLTELVAAEQALRESESRFRALADAVPAMVWSMVDGGMDYCNQWCTDYVGRSLEQMRGDGWTAAVHPHDVALAQATWTRAFEIGEVFEAEFRMCRAAEDRYRWQLVRGVPLQEPDGSIIRWFATAVDIHDRREAEGAERAARAEAEAARRTAEAATAAKGRMLAAASHDLRTPLVAIAGYAELLATEVFGTLNDDQKRALQRMDSAQRHLLVLVNDILAAARAEAGGTVPIDLTDVALTVLCDELESLVVTQAEARRIVYRCSVTERSAAPHAPLAVRADGVRVLQILVNLVTNAIKNTDAGGSIVVDAVADDRWVYLHVRDSGCGIPPDQLESIFGAFVQFGSTGSREGVGLGLATSRDLARRMGGDLVAESAVGVGSTFTLSLPLGGSR